LLDLADLATVRAFAAGELADPRPIDTLINNAGGSCSADFTVSSEAHTMGGPVPVEDLNSERDYRPLRAYAKTKLENILFTRELQRRAGNRLLAVACHPGVVDTNLPAHSILGMKLLFWAAHRIIQHAAEGAQSTLLAATAAKTQPGGYYGPAQLFKIRGAPVETEPAPFAQDEHAAKELFEDWSESPGFAIRFSEPLPWARLPR
jgi:NAD(P)-dependent dehydrogenase (short-subunit alcohol dehydrogenase family)